MGSVCGVIIKKTKINIHGRVSHNCHVSLKEVNNE